MEEKTYPFEVKSLNEEGVFEGHAAIFNTPDLLNEIVEPKAFAKSTKENKVFPLLWYHDPRIPLGIARVEPDEKGLKVNGEFDLNVQAAREKHSLMKKKAIRGLSFGFNTIKDTWKDGMRYLKEVKLFEISPCTFQAHPDALVMNVKSLLEIKSFDEALKSTKGALAYFMEIKSGKMISAANLKLINNAVEALVVILKKLEPSADTQDEGKGLYSSIIEGLEKQENKPHGHLFGSTIETLEQI